jgi:hypothetical protein
LVLNFYQVQLAEISHREDFEAVQSSLKLQQLQSNFTSLVFGYSDGPLASDFKGTTTVNYDAKVGFNVVVIGPHYGYATINQTYFKPYDLSDYHFLNPKCLPAASVLSEGGYILSVAPGAFERISNCIFG